MNKTDRRILKTGIKRVVVAMFTAFLFALSVCAVILTATATGYWAVILFISAIVLLIWAIIFLYAQGIASGGGHYVEK